MPKVTMQSLGRRLSERRGSLGVRAAAKEIGISAATLSRVERGNMPDLRTFGKICEWLGIDPADVLGGRSRSHPKIDASVHFKKGATVAPETARSLANLILAAQRSLELEIQESNETDV